MTICAQCKHCSDPGDTWARCRVEATREAYDTISPVTGRVVHHEAEYRYCYEARNGSEDCALFEPRPPRTPKPQPAPRLPWWQRIWRRA